MEQLNAPLVDADFAFDPNPATDRARFVNAHHSPIGAFASFTLGAKGGSGGLGLELRGPADENVYIGIEDREEAGQYWALPFYSMKLQSEAEDYDVEGLADFHVPGRIRSFPDAQIDRKLGAAVDTWTAGDLTFRLVSPVQSAPDPAATGEEILKRAYVPAVVAELTLDNRESDRPRKAFFGYGGSGRASAMRVWREGELVGVAQGTETAIATLDEGVYGGLAWQPEKVLHPSYEANLPFMLGDLGLLVGEVPAGEVRTFRFAVAFFREGSATTGLRTRYLYRRWFDRVEEVALAALRGASALVQGAEEFDAALESRLDATRSWMLAHAIRSYFGSTQLLETEDGRPFWVVNEGEYRMMNTFDLTVDQAFFELALNPWTVRNELEWFVERYSYEDEVLFPGQPDRYPGGLVFTHDMGVGNTFSAPGRSGYEQAGLTGCFSHMSCEELMNWILTAAMYLHRTGDSAWAHGQAGVFRACLSSLLNRDHPDPEKRNGVMSLDSSRCEGGAEITTYDSLDASLGQARNNLYLAVKGWACYVLLERIFAQIGKDDLAQTCETQAQRAATTVVGSAGTDGLLPAVIGEGVEARIIPAIEGLVYPFVTGRHDVLREDGPYAELLRTLRRHFAEVLRPGICKFDDGGWRLSSTSRNSWLSKIYLCQYVAERVLGEPVDSDADEAHRRWLTDERNAYYAWSDQMLQGRAVGSRYYPRGVTGILWTAQSEDPIAEIGNWMQETQS
jgi:hypothetical protein